MDQKRLENAGETGSSDDSISDFGPHLAKLTCPVLAIFGGRDRLVDWEDSRRLYEKNVRNLTVHVFADANHALQRCVTGSVREIFTGPCLGHYGEESMQLQVEWLKSIGAGKPFVGFS